MLKLVKSDLFIVSLPPPTLHHQTQSFCNSHLRFGRDFTSILRKIWMLKRIKYEIRLGEPNKPMSTGPKKVEPILCVGPWQNEGPDLPTKFQKTCFTRMKLALQGWILLCKDKTCSTRMRLALQGWDLLYKEKTCSTRKGGRTSLL